MMREILGRVTVEQNKMPSCGKRRALAMIIRTGQITGPASRLEKVLWDTYVSAWHNNSRSWSAQRRKAWRLHHRMLQDTDKECLLVGIARVVGFLQGKTRPARMTSKRTARYPCWRKSRWVAE